LIDWWSYRETQIKQSTSKIINQQSPQKQPTRNHKKQINST
jgi:hypothetical protein